MKNKNSTLMSIVAVAVVCLPLHVFAMDTFGSSNQPQPQIQPEVLRPTTQQPGFNASKSQLEMQPDQRSEELAQELAITKALNASSSWIMPKNNPIAKQAIKENNPFLQVYFSPQDQAKIMEALSDLLDNAKKQIYIAMYWITDTVVMEKIIAAKRRNVDVQIIIDESSLNYMDVVPQFLDNNIVPIIYPSGNSDAAGKMHHKFVEVDGAVVFTGSANFTKTVLDSKIRSFNFENILVIHSTDIAQRFIDAFVSMEKEIFDFYVNIIASKALDTLSVWMSRVIPVIYQKQDLMKASVKQPIQNYTLEGQRRIDDFFSVQLTERREERITEPQKKLLNMHGFADREIVGLSKKESSALISKVKSGNWIRATKNQRQLLRDGGYPNSELLQLSEQEAAQLIRQGFGKNNQQQYRW